MPIGESIDSQFLISHIPAYKSRSKDSITAKERADVARERMGMSQPDASAFLKMLVMRSGRGVSTLCMFYNATGDPLLYESDYSWEGAFFDPDASPAPYPIPGPPGGPPGGPGGPGGPGRYPYPGQDPFPGPGGSGGPGARSGGGGGGGKGGGGGGKSKNPPVEKSVANGQWFVFLHQGSSADIRGVSEGWLVVRTSPPSSNSSSLPSSRLGTRKFEGNDGGDKQTPNPTDIFLSFLNPGSGGQNRCYVEVREKDHWKDLDGMAPRMKGLLESAKGEGEDGCYGYQVEMDIDGGKPAAWASAVLHLKD